MNENNTIATVEAVLPDDKNTTVEAVLPNPVIYAVGREEYEKNTTKHGSLTTEINDISIDLLESNLNNEIHKVTLHTASESQIGLMGSNDKKKLNKLYKNVSWNNHIEPYSNVNDFTTYGVYHLYGSRTRYNDNLPIANTGGGHTFDAILTVLDSSIERAEGEPQSDDKCITQLLTFSNRLGQGEVYIRTGKGKTIDSLSWDNWSTLQRNVNVGQVGNLDDFVDNGIYSGIYTDDYTFQAPTFIDTFTLIVINNYAVASKDSRLKRTISQLKYAVDAITNQASVKQRTKTDGDDKWSDWTDIGGNYTLPIATTDTLGGVKVYETKGKVSSGPSGAEYSVNIRPDGTLYTTVDHADETHEGVVYVDNSVEPKSNNPVSGKGVAEYVAKNGGGGDITATPTEEVINDIEPTLVTDALRKTPQVLTDTEKEIARGNIGAVSYSDLSSAISNAIVNVLNTAV